MGRTYNENEESYSTSKNRIRENQRRQEEIVHKRKEGHVKSIAGTILEVNLEYSDRRPAIEVIIKDVADEKVYITKCHDVTHMLAIVIHCCGKYRVGQIHIDVSGCGMPVYEALVEHIKGVDIVPLRYVAMTF